MKNNFKEKTAFTLAEVLITLGIIGIVSAMTIPTLVKNYQKKVLKTRFNKAIAQINQAIKLMQVDCNCDIYSTYINKNEALRENYFKHFKGNFSEQNLNNIIYLTSKKGSTTETHNCPINGCARPAVNSYISNDGIMYNASARGLLSFAFDLNGYQQGPNKWGVDLFVLHFYSDKGISTILNNNKGLASGTGCVIYNIPEGTTHTNDGLGCTYWAFLDQDYFNKIDW